MNVEVIATGRMARAPFDCPTLLASDAHMNRNGAQNNFGEENAKLFRGFLGAYLPTAWRVILAGDWWDIWEALRLGLILTANDLTCALLRRYRVLCLKGNHDEDAVKQGIARYFPTWEFAEIIDTPDVRIEHGHRLDPACSGTWAWIGRAATFAWACLETVYVGRLLRPLMRVVNRRRMTTARRRSGNQVYIDDAVNRVREAQKEGRQPQVLFAGGHSHKELLLEIAPGIYYLNLGSWTGKGVGYAAQIIGRDITLFRITNSTRRAA